MSLEAKCRALVRKWDREAEQLFKRGSDIGGSVFIACMSELECALPKPKRRKARK